jgi:hypothetical protein
LVFCSLHIHTPGRPQTVLKLGAAGPIRNRSPQSFPPSVRCSCFAPRPFEVDFVYESPLNSAVVFASPIQGLLSLSDMQTVTGIYLGSYGHTTSKPLKLFTSAGSKGIKQCAVLSNPQECACPACRRESETCTCRTHFRFNFDFRVHCEACLWACILSASGWTNALKSKPPQKLETLTTRKRTASGHLWHYSVGP